MFRKLVYVAKSFLSIVFMVGLLALLIGHLPFWNDLPSRSGFFYELNRVNLVSIFGFMFLITSMRNKEILYRYIDWISLQMNIYFIYIVLIYFLYSFMLVYDYSQKASVVTSTIYGIVQFGVIVLAIVLRKQKQQ